jgi:hypothetical protein
MIARLVFALAILALGAAACGKGDASKTSKEESPSSSPGYDLPAPPADDEKKK